MTNVPWWPDGEHEGDAPKQDSPSPWDETKHVTASAEDIINPDGESTLVMCLRVGLRDEEFFFSQAIPTRFLEFLRAKDTDGMFRNNLADYLHEVAEKWRNGDVFKS
jgi:hypothetical protein